MPSRVQADEDALKWTEIPKPGLLGNIVVSPSEVSDIAVGFSGTIYSLDSSQNATKTSKIYQSINAGETWEDITSRLSAAGAGVVLPATKIAIAPDTNDTVAVVTNSGTKVYLSTDGGVTWADTGVPGLAGTIQAIAISPQETGGDASQREIAIGTADWGNITTTGQVWVYQMGPIPLWRNQSLTVDTGPARGEVSAIAYSPMYQGDDTILVVASTGGDVALVSENKTWLCIGIRDTTSGTTNWNQISGYPVEIATTSSPSKGDAIGVSINSSLALPSDYTATDEYLRKVFVSYNRNPDASDDVYRLDDTTVYRLNANQGANLDICSISYNGTTTAGQLLVGEANSIAGTQTVRIRRTSDPFDTSPAWLPASTCPTGPGNAKVSWNPEGDSAYCGTSQSPGAARDESAFSMSSDDGDNWQQLSLIDTTLKISDIAPVPGSDTLFIATYSAFGPQAIWQTNYSTQQEMGLYWSRQFTMVTSAGNVTLRLSPDYASDSTIYAVEAGGNQLAVSKDGGYSWKKRWLADAGTIDLVVEDSNTIYVALPGGFIRKSINSGFIWGEPVATGLPAINMLAVAAQGTIFVGGRNGEVAYSTDGGASFTRINNVMNAGDVQVVADPNYQENSLIYAANNAPDKGIWRWTIGSSTSWEQIDNSITTLNTGQCIGGLAVSSEGTLYALRMEPAGPAGTKKGGMTRFLNPADPYDFGVDFTNDSLPTGASFNSTLVFPNTLPGLKVSGDFNQNDLWAIDTANDLIYRFQDTIASHAPMPILPANKFQNKVDQINGRAADIPFRWNSPSKNITGYELGIYIDVACVHRILLCLVPSTIDTPVVIIGPYQNTAGQFVNYDPGTTYYWRVRSTNPIKSPWSETRSFTVEPIAAQVTSLLSPANGGTGMSQTPAFSWSPISGTTKYQFVLANNAGLASPIVDTTVTTPAYAVTNMLEAGQTYFWAVRTVAPIESGWSAIANFTVQEKPVEPTPVVITEVPPPVVIIPEPLTQSPEIIILYPPAAPGPAVPAYIWVIIVIETLLLIAVVLILSRIGI